MRDGKVTCIIRREKAFERKGEQEMMAGGGT